MSEDQPRASSSPDDEDIEVTTDDAPPSPRPREQTRARRRKGKLQLRIPDDEVSRPQKVEEPPKAPSEPPPKVNGESEIKPSRIISVGPPPMPEEEQKEEETKRRIPSAPPTAPASDVAVAVDDEAATPALPPIAAKSTITDDSGDIDVPVDEDEPEYRPRQQTLPSNPPPPPGEEPKRATEPPPPDVAAAKQDGPSARDRISSSEALEIDEVEAAAVLSSRPPPPVISSKPPPPSPPIPADALSSTPQLEEAKAPSAPRPIATALVDEQEARGIEEVEPDRASAPPPESSEEVAALDVVTVESKPATAKADKPVSVPPKPAPPLPQKLLPIMTPAAGIPSPLAPPALSEGLVPRRRARPWWEELFNDDFIRTIPKFTDAQIAAEVDFIEDSLGVARGGSLLDLGCGTGRHAIELTRRGYSVVGFDLSLALLARAGEEAQERDQKLNFVQGDMREMTFEEAFDGIYCWGSTFGFFEEEKNAHVVSRVHKALRQGGQFLLDVTSRDFIIAQAPSLAWFEGEGCVCMDEMQVDWITSRMRVKRTMMLDDGRSKEIEYSIRVYSLHELGKMLHDAGFRVAEVSGRIQTPGVYFGPCSPRTLILAEKR